MCLYINTDFHPDIKPRVAEADLLVYKVLADGLSSKSQYVTPHQRMGVTFDKGMFGYRVPDLTPVEWGEYFVVNEGIHTYVSYYNGAENHWWAKTFSAIIPKGSRFYVGEDGDIVSDNLMIFEDWKFSEFYKENNVKLMKDVL